MAFLRIDEFYPNYRKKLFGGDDIKGLAVYASGTDSEIGIVLDALVDWDGRFQYLVIDTSRWGFTKKVLLPINSCLVDYEKRRVYADGINKQKVQYLPTYYSTAQVDEDYEQQVRLIYEMPNANYLLAEQKQSISYRH
ncbi:PRC-barrel domain-containing protein [Aerosakkonema funiforme]|uniref:PRC-barrel domain-containing protein n=1 Tax=Aerosakkonema funiforme TaxID=1246630 RepID=UPI0035B89524